MVMHIDVNIGQTYSSWTVPGDPVNHFGSIAFGSVALSNNGSSEIRHPAHIWSIALSSDDNYLAVSDANNKITLLNLSDIISNYYLVGQRAAQPPQNRRVKDLQPQNADLRNKLDGLELHVDELGQGTTWSHELVRAEQPIPLRILDGNYLIKSKTRDLCLTWSDGSSRVCAQSNESSPFQVWTISSVANGAYSIMCYRRNSDALSVGNAGASVCISGGRRTAWTIEPRGDSYVSALTVSLPYDPPPLTHQDRIGNAEDATAIHIGTLFQTVIQFMFDSCALCSSLS
ncbi:hypothetical protein JVT61DRAFT_5716 [Boletus reticuloceps]|uniref:Lectin n=1 Tax=Boletus reticuloceps TaxID=495285 RepID=A0A8I2YXI6_9AGAM|nr:hypothetical protein JVT61DRAFT_5716 [Boletus reticuloceps]